MNPKLLFRAAGVLWAMWGLLHLTAGMGVLLTFAHEVTGVPESVTLRLMGGDMPFQVRQEPRRPAGHPAGDGRATVIVEGGS